MSTVLLHVHDDEGFDSRLEAALSLARALPAHLHCSQPVSIANMLGDAYPATLWGGAWASGELLKTIDEQADAIQEKVQTKLKREAVPWSWRRLYNDAAPSLVQESVLADVTVVSAPKKSPDVELSRSFVADAAMSLSTPLLTVPVGHPRFEPAGPVLIAWDGSVEVARTIRLSRDMLRLASEIRIVTAGKVERWQFDNEDLAAYLSRLGLSVEISDVVEEGGTADTLIREARYLDASYIVMGAYGHSRMREFMLGGVTRKLLVQDRFPLLMHH